jgi:hypothetical protein
LARRLDAAHVGHLAGVATSSDEIAIYVMTRAHLQKAFPIQSTAQELRGGCHGGQRIAQVMRDGRQETVLESVRFVTGACLGDLLKQPAAL